MAGAPSLSRSHQTMRLRSHIACAPVCSVSITSPERPFSADEAAGIARAMHGENGHDQVESKPLVQVVRLEAEEALVQGTHPYTVDADEPGSLRALVAQDPGACGGVAFV